MSFIRLAVGFALIAIGLPILVHASPKASVHKETLRGYLVDLVCVKQEAGKLADLGPNHTTKCLQMPVCAQGGYAVLLPSNEVLAFDKHGNELARRLFASRNHEKGLAIKVIGTRETNVFRVAHIDWSGVSDLASGQQHGH